MASSPFSSQVSLSIIITRSSLDRNALWGEVSTNRKLPSSVISQASRSTSSIYAAVKEELAARSREYITSSAVKALPFWKVTSLRSVMSSVVSFSHSHSVAS